MNTVNLAGRIADDPVKSTSSNGLAFTKFKITVDKNGKEGNSNGYDIFEVVVFRELADIKLKVGQFVGVTGKLSANNYEKEDKSFFNCSIIGNAVTLLGN